MAKGKEHRGRSDEATTTTLGIVGYIMAHCPRTVQPRSLIMSPMEAQLLREIWPADS